MNNITHIKSSDKKHVLVNYNDNYLVVNIRTSKGDADALLDHDQVIRLHKTLSNYLEHREKLIKNFTGGKK